MRKKYNLDKELDDIQLAELKSGAKNPLCYTFAVRLRRLLIEKQINQDELARQARCCTASSISVYLQAKQEPKAEILVGFAKVLDVSVDYLLGLTDCQNPEIEARAIHNAIGLSDKAIGILQDHNWAAGRAITNTLNILIEQEAIDWTKKHNGPRVLSAIQDYFEITLDENTKYKITKEAIEPFQQNNARSYYGTFNTISGKSLIDMIYMDTIRKSLKELKCNYILEKGTKTK